MTLINNINIVFIVLKTPQTKSILDPHHLMIAKKEAKYTTW